MEDNFIEINFKRLPHIKKAIYDLEIYKPLIEAQDLMFLEETENIKELSILSGLEKEDETW